MHPVTIGPVTSYSSRPIFYRLLETRGVATGWTCPPHFLRKVVFETDAKTLSFQARVGEGWRPRSVRCLDLMSAHRHRVNFGFSVKHPRAVISVNRVLVYGTTVVDGGAQQNLFCLLIPLFPYRFLTRACLRMT